MDELIKKVAAFGVPGIVLVVATSVSVTLVELLSRVL